MIFSELFNLALFKRLFKALKNNTLKKALNSNKYPNNGIDIPNEYY